MHTSLMRKLVNDLANHKSKQDIQGALEVYHPQAELVTTGFNTKAQGTLEIEQQLSVFFKVFPDYQVLLTQVACNDQALLATGDIYVTPNLHNQTCKTVGQPASFAFEFKENRISKEVFFLDVGQLCKKAKITTSQLSNAMKQFITEKSTTE